MFFMISILNQFHSQSQTVSIGILSGSRLSTKLYHILKNHIIMNVAICLKQICALFKTMKPT